MSHFNFNLSMLYIVKKIVILFLCLVETGSLGNIYKELVNFNVQASEFNNLDKIDIHNVSI